MVDELTAEWIKIDNKVRFVTDIIEGNLIVQNRKKTDIILELKQKGFEAIYSKKRKEKQSTDGDLENEEEEEVNTSGGYDYLLSMPIWNLTKEKVTNYISS